MELFNILSDFLNDKPEMKLLLTVDGKAFISYLAYIFEKLNMLNKQLQGTYRTLVDTMAKIFGFITYLEYVKRMFLPKILTSFIG